MDNKTAHALCVRFKITNEGDLHSSIVDLIGPQHLVSRAFARLKRTWFVTEQLTPKQLQKK